MRASRLLELLLLLQLRGAAPASELAAELEVSVRTVYRDVDALAAAGVPVYTEPGRNGGIRLLEGYRPAGLPRLDDAEARSLLLTAIPTVAHDLGLDTTPAEQKLLAAMDAPAESAARSVRERVLVEPEPWWMEEDDTSHLAEVARAVWEGRELRITYRSGGAERDRVVQPLGLVLKGGIWYVMARSRRGGDRVYRLSRIAGAVVLDHRFERPPAFDLAAAWQARKEAFAASIPTYWATVRVSPAGEPLLARLEEGTPRLPLADDVDRDEHGWAVLRLRFERPRSAARLLLQLGADIEVLDPPELRDLVATTAADVSRLYRRSAR